MLGVDAVIAGNVSSSRPNSEEVAWAARVALNVRVATKTTTLRLKIIDLNSELLWKYRKSWSNNDSNLSGSGYFSMYKKAARKLPWGHNNTLTTIEY